MKFYALFALITVLTITTACKKKEPDPIIPPAPTKDTTELKNDGYTSGTPIFLNGFQAGEEGAVTLVGPNKDFKLLSVMFFYGGTGSQPRDAILKIYEEQDSVVPGAVLYSANHHLTPSQDEMLDVDLSGQNLTFSASDDFRISLEFSDSGYPSIARDSDGSVDVDKNFFKDASGWTVSTNKGINGDWIIRAMVETDK